MTEFMFHTLIAHDTIITVGAVAAAAGRKQ
ncbi:hypothetical protein N181_17590 [Sinorhizobium fredii USDA 205]|nr:hypothetical protein N181_17590 [Sinorhizobium fredii USDA 205]